MNQPPRGTELAGHLTPEELAVLAERGGHGASREAVEHLARCRSCMSAYADLVRYRAGWLAFPEAFDGDEDPESRPSGDPGATRDVRKRLTRPQQATLLAAAAAVVIVFGLATGWRASRLEPPRDAGPLTTLLERASAEGLVIPGGEAGAAGMTSPYRSAPVVDDASEQALDRWLAKFENRPPSYLEAQNLAAGLLAAGRLDLAGDYIREGLTRAPGDLQLLTLAGILAHRRGDLVQAERSLHDALGTSPGDLTAMLDLGLVLAEAGRMEEAEHYLNDVIGRAPRSPLADRARRALDRLLRR
jgi:tetratricopeptide (TPR) repeat protein